MMETFSKIFIETTDPNSNYKRILSLDVFFSIIFHSIFYLFIFYLFSKFFGLSNMSKIGYFKTFIFLLLLMFFGYIGRLYRSKSMYNTLLKKEKSSEVAYKKTLNMMKDGYFVYYFFA